MAGRWGGDIKGRRRSSAQSRKKRDWQAPRVPPQPSFQARLRAGGVVLAGAGSYFLCVAGALLTSLA